MAKILIVEDNPDLRYMVRLLLEYEGFEVDCAENGQVALDLLLGADQPPPRPDLIILDLMMPVMSGHEFLERRSRFPELSKIPIVVFSAVASDLPEGLPFLRKPIDPQELVSAVKKQLA